MAGVDLEANGHGQTQLGDQRCLEVGVAPAAHGSGKMS